MDLARDINWVAPSGSPGAQHRIPQEAVVFTQEWKVELPSVTAWADLFEEYGDWPPACKRPPYEGKTLLATDWLPPHQQKLFTIGSYCQVQGETPHRSYWVRPNAQVLRHLEEVLIRVPNDKTSFKVIVWNDAKALVVVDHGQILGSHWLAFIDPSTLPLPKDTTDAGT